MTKKVVPETTEKDILAVEEQGQAIEFFVKQNINLWTHNLWGNGHGYVSDLEYCLWNCHAEWWEGTGGIEIYKLTFRQNVVDNQVKLIIWCGTVKRTMINIDGSHIPFEGKLNSLDQIACRFRKTVNCKKIVIKQAYI